MEIAEILLGALVALFAGLNVFQLFSFKAYKNKYHAKAEQEEAEAYASKQSAYEARLKSVEELYAAQGMMLDTLRKEMLKLSNDKFESDKRMVQLEVENRDLRNKVDRLENEVAAYKTIASEGRR